MTQEEEDRRRNDEVEAKEQARIASIRSTVSELDIPELDDVIRKHPNGNDDWHKEAWAEKTKKIRAKEDDMRSHRLNVEARVTLIERNLTKPWWKSSNFYWMLAATLISMFCAIVAWLSYQLQAEQSSVPVAIPLLEASKTDTRKPGEEAH